MKVARTVRRGAVGKAPKGNSLAAYPTAPLSSPIVGVHPKMGAGCLLSESGFSGLGDFQDSTRQGKEFGVAEEGAESDAPLQAASKEPLHRNRPFEDFLVLAPALKPVRQKILKSPGILFIHKSRKSCFRQRLPPSLGYTRLDLAYWCSFL